MLGNYTISGGTLNITNRLNLGETSGSTGTLIISGNSTVTVTNGPTILGDNVGGGAGGTGTITQSGTSTVNLNGGYVSIGTNGTATYRVGAGAAADGSGAAGVGTVNQSAGVTHVTGGMIIGNDVVGPPSVENSYSLSGGVLDFGDSAGVTQPWGSGTTPSTLRVNYDAAFNFTGGTLQDVTTINMNGATFSQQGNSAFYIGKDEGPSGYAQETAINGGYSLLGGVLYLNIFGADPSPEQCCDNVASMNDQLTVEGVALLDSTIGLDYEGFEPEFGEAFTLICADEITLGAGFHIDGGFFRIVPAIGDPNGPMALQAIVPEPASVAAWTIIGLAGAGWAWRMRRRGRRESVATQRFSRAVWLVNGDAAVGFYRTHRPQRGEWP